MMGFGPRGMSWCNMVWNGLIWYGMPGYGFVCYVVLQFGRVWWGTACHGSPQVTSTQHCPYWGWNWPAGGAFTRLTRTIHTHHPSHTYNTKPNHIKQKQTIQSLDFRPLLFTHTHYPSRHHIYDIYHTCNKKILFIPNPFSSMNQTLPPLMLTSTAIAAPGVFAGWMGDCMIMCKSVIYHGRVG